MASSISILMISYIISLLACIFFEFKFLVCIKEFWLIWIFLKSYVNSNTLKSLSSVSKLCGCMNIHQDFNDMISKYFSLHLSKLGSLLRLHYYLRVSTDILIHQGCFNMANCCFLQKWLLQFLYLIYFFTSWLLRLLVLEKVTFF